MTTPSSEPPISDDVTWAFDAVEDVSRTFAISISMLDEPMATWICDGYLLCRIADTIEDASHIPPETQVELLNTYDEVLNNESSTTAETFVECAREWIPDSPTADWVVVAETPRVIRVFESFDEPVQDAIRPVVSEMVGGMADFITRYKDAGGLRIRTVDELEEYCWYVAGTVGELITNLIEYDLGVATESMRENAKSFALLLQLVNIAKDVQVDYQEENNVYLPAEWLEQEGVHPDAVGHDEHTQAVARVVNRLTKHAKTYADGAFNYLSELPDSKTTLEAWSVPYLLALGTMRELEDRPQDAVCTTDSVKVSREEVFALLERVHSEFTHSDLDQIRSVVEERPFHQVGN